MTTPKKALKRLLVRDVGDKNRLLLYVLAGGRCEFDGCQRYLIEHPLTRNRGNFAQIAHICAFSSGGPRANKKLDIKSVNALDNLMLLCPQCHKQVDDEPKQWTAPVLRRHKKAHEERIYKLTSTRPDRYTVALWLRGQIHGRIPTLSLAEMQEAVSPRHVGERDVCEIDLTQQEDDSSDAYWKQGTKTIRRRVARFYDETFDSGPVRHASVFGLARIPLLVFLGQCLSDKAPNTLYQRHRNPNRQAQTWRWKVSGRIARYRMRCLRRGSDPNRVALLLSLSDRINRKILPEEVDESFSIYELTLDGQRPSYFYLEREKSVDSFTQAYLAALDDGILDDHPDLNELFVFPAVPAPIAIAMGRDLLPARHPTLVVYDLVKDNGVSKYIRTIEVNSREEKGV